MGSLEGEIATSFGVGSVCIQDGSDGDSEGPVNIPKSVFTKIKSTLKSGKLVTETLRDTWEEVHREGVSLDDVIQMVKEGAKQDTDYYRLKGEDLIFGTDAEGLRNDWLDSLSCLPSDWNEWDEMDADEIQCHLDDFGIEAGDAPDDEVDEDQ